MILMIPLWPFMWLPSFRWTPAYTRPCPPLCRGPSPHRTRSHPTIHGGTQGIRTLLLQVMSLACCQYTMRPVRRGERSMGETDGGLGGVEAQVQPRRPAPDNLNSLTCMTTCEWIRTQVLLPLLRMERE